MLRRVVLASVPIVLVAAMGLVAQPAVAAEPAPSHMAAVGDSITRAFDVSGSYFLKDAPAESWSTGTDTRVNSELLRLQAKNASIVAENDAVTGAKMATLGDQMKRALTNGADYITVLMGANDVCTKTTADMTPVETFKSQFATALALTKDSTVTGGRTVRVFVSSIPRVNRLWELYGSSSTARFTWSLYGICQDLLSSRATTTDRANVAARVVDDNGALASVCTDPAYAGICYWDGGATYRVQFQKTDVSTVDYFHPSVVGQGTLATTAWPLSPYAP